MFSLSLRHTRLQRRAQPTLAVEISQPILVPDSSNLIGSTLILSDLQGYPPYPVHSQTSQSNMGGVAQMVERSLSMREVPGSIPGASKTFSQLCDCHQTLRTNLP